jgi:hypothetical protein
MGNNSQAFFHTRFGRFCTVLAMLFAMFGTFFRTDFADFCAVFTYQCDKFAVPLHVLNRQLTEFRAISIEGNTSLHHGRMGFTLASLDTFQAGSHRLFTGFDTGLILRIRHVGSP